MTTRKRQCHKEEEGSPVVLHRRSVQTCMRLGGLLGAQAPGWQAGWQACLFPKASLAMLLLYTAGVFEK
jgi:hypothetical protein